MYDSQFVPSPFPDYNYGLYEWIGKLTHVHHRIHAYISISMAKYDKNIIVRESRKVKLSQ